MSYQLDEPERERPGRASGFVDFGATIVKFAKFSRKDMAAIVVVCWVGERCGLVPDKLGGRAGEQCEVVLAAWSRRFRMARLQAKSKQHTQKAL